MSFILDALKKSEMERQRQATPSLVDTGMVRPRPRLPIWAIALCVLLAVNLIVLLVMLTRNSSSSSPAVPPRAIAQSGRPDTAASDSRPAAMAGGHFSPLDAPPVYAPEIPEAAAPVAAPAVASKPTSSRIPGSSKTHSVHRPDPVLNDQDYKANDEEALPTINEINLTGAQALPDLHLDVHVYATQSAERFVFINMRKYHEGATLEEGPTIERIRRNGVVLNYQGLRFLLPRQ
jgi:general secretion pathway protein B